MKQILTILLLLSAVSSFSCRPQENDEASMEMAVKDMAMSPAEGGGASAMPAVERKIVTEGTIRFETSDIAKTKLFLARTIKESKGYISAENVSALSDKIEHNLTMRIPADKFDNALNAISRHIDKFDQKNINANDVTEEYVDISARIKTKKEIENRYRELLQKAKTVDEMLSIERELGNIRSEIESVEGRMAYLNNKISYSTLTAIYYEKTSSDSEFSLKFGEAIKDGWKSAIVFFIELIHYWVFIVLFIAGIYLFSRKRRSKKNKASA